MPKWFQDAKFGVMIHWGLYSVPGYAPTGTTLDKLLETQYDHAMTHRNPYAEDTANAMKDPDLADGEVPPGSTTATRPYADFAKTFEAGLTNGTRISGRLRVKAAGASYVVVTAKYADGYSMWPTEVRNPHARDFHSKRDLMGELATAVRKQGLKSGSPPAASTGRSKRRSCRRSATTRPCTYGEDYREYVDRPGARADQPIQAGHPLNDISWPPARSGSTRSSRTTTTPSPEGVVDDRWRTASFGTQLMSPKPMRWGVRAP